MRLFLDTSVLLAACGSSRGASRAVFRLAGPAGWRLISSPYAIAETLTNLPKLPVAAMRDWLWLRPRIHVVDDILTLDRPALFAVSKDRPILFSAVAFADFLLTLDRVDFGDLLGSSFYGLQVLTPGDWLTRQRRSGNIAPQGEV